jgi:hypothetical protein
VKRTLRFIELVDAIWAMIEREVKNALTMSYVVDPTERIGSMTARLATVL